MNGGFVYIRSKTIPDKVIKIWETMPQDNDEPAFAKFIDNMMGGWDNSERCLKLFWEQYETPYCMLWNSSPWTKEMIDTKDKCFIHFI